MPAQFPATIELSDLKGVKGFMLNGVSPSKSGFSVASTEDINGDGLSDLFIGAPYGRSGGSDSGQAYVVFGDVSIGSTGVIQLSSLDGKEGFILIGESQSLAGHSVASAGDVNGDDFIDLILSAPYAQPNGLNSGQSYVIFGNSSLGSGGSIELSSLQGTVGFKLNGYVDTYCGYSVASAGDVNGDGFADLIIGEVHYSPNGANSGESYVVFGGNTVGSSGVIELSSLNGIEGFKLYGINDSFSGWSVASAGDVNGDGLMDLIIGALDASPNGYESGQSYVVFGDKSLGSTGIIELSSLNGLTGFKLNGVKGSQSGRSVSSAGDLNADGFADLIIGATDIDSSYVIFGDKKVGSSGIIELSSLNGTVGFKLNGYKYTSCGQSVASAGDVNGDGLPDLIIGAPNASPNGEKSGQSYVVFGAKSFNGSSTIELSDLHGLRGFSLNGIDSNSLSGQSVASAGDINGDGLDDLIIGAPDVAIYSGASGQSYVVFGDSQDLSLLKNRLSIEQGETTILGLDNLNITCSKCLVNRVTFSISDLANGHFAYKVFPDDSIINFSLQNVTDGNVCFVHDGSPHSPEYKVSVFSGRWVTTVPETAMVYFGPLILVNNSITVIEGRTQTITASNLYALNNNIADDQITFTIESLEYGRFETPLDLGKPIYNFTQQQIKDREILFTQNGTANSPSYSVVVSYGSHILPAFSSQVTFYYMPVLLVNRLTVPQGKTVLLGTENLQAHDPQVQDKDLIFSISALKNGRFHFAENPEVPIVNFTQGQLNINSIQFTQDGSAIPPSYNVSVQANNLISTSQAATIDWIPGPISPRASDNKTERNLFISAFVTVGALGSLAICYVMMGFLQKHRLHAMVDDTEGELAQFYKEVVIPIAKAVFKQIKITSFMNYISADQMEAYVAEIATIVNELNKLGISTELQQMESGQKIELIGQITKQMKHHLDIQTSKCNRTWLVSFFKPQITPEQIGEKAKIIAESVHNALLGNNIIGSINVPTNLDLTDIIGQAPSEKEFTTGYVQMP